MRHPVAQQLAAALRDDAQPSARIVLEIIAFERIKLVTNKDGDRHCPTPHFLSSQRSFLPTMSKRHPFPDCPQPPPRFRCKLVPCTRGGGDYGATRPTGPQRH